MKTIFDQIWLNFNFRVILLLSEICEGSWSSVLETVSWNKLYDFNIIVSLPGQSFKGYHMLEKERWHYFGLNYGFGWRAARVILILLFIIVFCPTKPKCRKNQYISFEKNAVLYFSFYYSLLYYYIILSIW